MEAWGLSMSKLLVGYEDGVRARLDDRARENVEAEAALASTLQEVQDNISIDQAKLDDEQIQLKDQVLKLQDEVIAILDILHDKYIQSEELKNKASTLREFHIKESEERRSNLDWARNREDLDYRNALMTQIEELIEARPRKKHRHTEPKRSPQIRETSSLQFISSPT